VRTGPARGLKQQREVSDATIKSVHLGKRL
jgi:hypothetical protein